MRISTSELKPGLEVARDLQHAGILLLREGTELTTVLIDVLKQRGVKQVDVSADSLRRVTGGDESYIHGLNEVINRKKEEERQFIDDLFSGIPESDEQMRSLKYCLVRRLQEKYSNAD